MSTSEDAGIDCKICRGPPEPEAPLYSPCKCKGSIGSVHETCLFDWLDVNGKSSRGTEKCEVCGTPFRFQKVYKHVPQHLPYQLVAKQLGRTVVWAALLVARFALVAFCWIGLVPWCTVWSFRFLLFIGTSLTYVLTGAQPRSSPVRQVALELLAKSQEAASQNETIHIELKHGVNQVSLNSTADDLSGAQGNATIWEGAKAVFANAGKDCFTGQIIMCAVVIVFIAIFLLREWINQQQPADGALDAVHAAHEDGAEAQAEEPPPQPLLVQEPAEALHRFLDLNARREDPRFGLSEADQEKLLDRYKHLYEHGNLNSAELTHLTGYVMEQIMVDIRQGKLEDILNHTTFLDLFQARLETLLACYLDERARGFPSLSPSSERAGSSLAFFDWVPPEEIRGVTAASSSSDTYPGLPLLTLDRAQQASQQNRPQNIPQAGPSHHQVESTPEAQADADSPGSHTSHLGDSNADGPQYIHLPSLTRRSASPDWHSSGESSPANDLARVAGAFDDHSSTASGYESATDNDGAEEREALRRQMEQELEDEIEPARLPRENSRLGEAIQSHRPRREEGPQPELDRELEAEADLDEGDDDNWMDVFDPQDDDAAAADAAADDAEAGLDDFDGILEAVGLRGNLFVLFQTVALMHLFVTVFLTLTVWLPFVIGRLMLGLNALYYLFIGPVKVVRTVTDRTDPPFALALKVDEGLTALVDAATLALGKGSNILASTLDPILSRLPTIALPTSTPSTDSRLFSSLFDQYKPKTLEIFAATREIWLNMAHNDEPVDRVLCIIVGYLVAGTIAGLWYYRESHLERPWSRRIQQHIASYGVLLKVAMFVVVELIAFPIVCGLCLNLMSLPMFKDASMASRLAFQVRAPYSSGFLHWAAGTLFMFVVAQWIALCRSTLRKGALFFIRDPRDPESHPIREMVEQSISTQFSKLGKSVLLYAALMANFLVVALVFHQVYPGFLPVRWRANEPLLSLPLDLLFAFLVIPASAKALKPVRTLRIIFTRFAKYAVHKMRLSAFFFGDSRPDEEGSYVYRTWWQTVTLGYGSKEEPDWKESGTMCRVPKSDHIKLLPGRPSTIPIDAEGNAKTPEGAETIAAQREAGLSEEDFGAIYTPPRFRFRLMLALYSLWVAGATFTITMATVPLLIGRGLVSALVGRELHDGYAFLLGVYTLYPFIFFGARHVRRSKSHSKKSRSKTSSSSRTRSRGLKSITLKACLTALARQTSKMALKVHGQGTIIYTVARTAILGGLLLPLLVGVHFYLVCSPLVTPRGELPTLWLPMLWCYGVAEGALVYSLARSIVPQWHPVALQAAIFAEQVNTESFQEYLDKIHTQLIKPEILNYIKNLVNPALLVLGSFGIEDALRVRGLDTSSEWLVTREFLFKISFSVQLVWSAQDSLLDGWQALSSKWLEALRDQEFLLERHILNYSKEEDGQEKETVVLDDAAEAQIEQEHEGEQQR